MERENNRNGLMVLMIILIIIIVELSSYLIYDKVMNKDEKVNNDNKVVNVSDFLANFVGEYKYEYIYENTLCVPNDKARYKISLQLNEDGTYDYGKGGDCTGGTSATGKYSIGSDGIIYLFNDECEPNEETCQYEDCSKIIEINYKTVDNQIVISDYDIVNNKTVELVKQ